jgi:uncharacterized protein with HEPN domain
MRRYGETIVRLLGPRTLEDFLSDEALRYALQYLLLIIGEASIHVPAADKTGLPDGRAVAAPQRFEEPLGPRLFRR